MVRVKETSFGPVVLFGSGETSPRGRQIWEAIARRLSAPLRVAILETPAGFELNSARVAGRIADFLQVRLQNYRPHITVVPARKRGTPFSPDDPVITAPILDANVIFLGPGSPTYAVRQLRDSLAWQRVMACHRLGSALVLASAAVIAISALALPVYEIYKVGEDPHWRPGLDFFAPYGLSLVFISHWNNAEGGA
ncbi:MAG: cysteinyl-tRNA synthetase, partial [Chloroflexota bacterium]